MSVPASTASARRRPGRRRYAPIAVPALALVTAAAFAAVLPSTASGAPVPALLPSTASDAGVSAVLPSTASGVETPAPASGVETPAPDTEPPTTPGQPQVLSVVPGAVTITWPPSSDNVGVTQYYVYQGDQFYSQYLARVVPDNSPLTLQLAPTAAQTHFSVTARDSAGNTSRFSSRTSVRQPPTFPRSGDDTVPPSPPGAPAVTAATPDGYLLSWEPATDDVGVVEYHVYHVSSVDEIRVDAKVSTNSAVIRPRGGYETVYVLAYDASWNTSSSPTVPLVPPPTPPANR